MIINTGNRTDIPAYYSEWFYNRIKEGFVYARNPYFENKITSYKLDPDVVDVLVFCTKNPKPMLDRIDEISMFRQFWHVTITAYDKDIEKNVPDINKIVDSFKELSNKVGKDCVAFRYDPIIITDKYNVKFHIDTFTNICSKLEGYTNNCVISFVDLYVKTKKNFKGIREVENFEQEYIVKEFVKIAGKCHINIRTCLENKSLEKFGCDSSGCLTKQVLEEALKVEINIPSSKGRSRTGCDCLLGNDIGTYNSCPHGCTYCYANYDFKTVKENYVLHDKNSPLLIGNVKEEDEIVESKQVSYCTGQSKLF